VDKKSFTPPLFFFFTWNITPKLPHMFLGEPFFKRMSDPSSALKKEINLNYTQVAS
jgi:hypothetical protein